jgi:hypothetical protein
MSSLPSTVPVPPDPAVPAAPIDTGGLGGHPRGLSTLFFTELWERFSYYGMRALLTIPPKMPIHASWFIRIAAMHISFLAS